MPLSAYLEHGLTYEPPKAPTLAPAPQEAPEDLRYFERLGYWMHRWLAKSSDASDALIASFHQIGLSVARGFEWRALDDATKRGLARAGRLDKVLDEANARRWTVVDMKRDWKVIYPFQR